MANCGHHECRNLTACQETGTHHHYEHTTTPQPCLSCASLREINEGLLRDVQNLQASLAMMGHREVTESQSARSWEKSYREQCDAAADAMGREKEANERADKALGHIDTAENETRWAGEDLAGSTGKGAKSATKRLGTIKANLKHAMDFLGGKGYA